MGGPREEGNTESEQLDKFLEHQIETGSHAVIIEVLISGQNSRNWQNKEFIYGSNQKIISKNLWTWTIHFHQGLQIEWLEGAFHKLQKHYHVDGNTDPGASKQTSGDNAKTIKTRCL